MLSAELLKQAKANGLSPGAKRMMQVRSFRQKDAWFWTLEPAPF